MQGSLTQSRKLNQHVQGDSEYTDSFTGTDISEQGSCNKIWFAKRRRQKEKENKK